MYVGSRIYDQVTQDGCSHVLYTTWLDQCLLHLHPTHMTDLPMYLHQVPADDWCNFGIG